MAVWRSCGLRVVARVCSMRSQKDQRESWEEGFSVRAIIENFSDCHSVELSNSAAA